MNREFPAEESGAAFSSVGTTDLIQHFGDPQAEYRAAVEAAVVRDRGHRAQWAFTGKQPLEMLKGVVTGFTPEAPEPRDLGVRAGRATYQTVLTPKGRIVSDLVLWREGHDDAETVRAHVPAAAAPALRAHLGRILPPRLARLEDCSADTGMVSVVGPDSARILSAVALGLRVERSELEQMGEDEFRILDGDGGDRITVMRNGNLSVPAFDLIGARDVLRSVWRLLGDAGVGPAGLRVWETLRVERGRPAWKTELTPDVIPVEAGIQGRAIDHGKGCYTGQEVIVRIRDRGHVNRHLRLLQLDIAAPLPAEGTELFREDDRAVGKITTAVDSPREGKLALAYVRREVGPGQTVQVGGSDGPRARVAALPDE